MNQIVTQLTDDEQLVFDIVLSAAEIECTNLRVAVAWQYSVNLLKIILVADHINRHGAFLNLPRSAQLSISSMTTHTTQAEFSIPISLFIRQLNQ